MAKDRRHRVPVHHISQLDQIECLVSPARGLLLSTLCGAGPCSVGELARLVGRKPRALYYHLDALVACGLVVEVGTRPTTRRQETLYDSLADTVQVDEHLLDSPQWQDAHRRASGAIFRQAMRTHLAALDDPASVTSGDSPEMRLQTTQVQLTEEGVARVNRKITELLTLIRGERERGEGRFYSVTLHLAPVVDAVNPGDDPGDDPDAD